MATVAGSNTIAFGPIMLRRVPYRVYARLSDQEENNHLRMTYHDGTLEIMSPKYRHERASSRIGMVVRAVVSELGIPCASSASTTFRRAGTGPFKGMGKEPDESFYITYESLIRDKDEIDLDAGDPPPDLWIEVDNRASSLGKPRVCAALGTPEVWRYRARKKSLDFLILTDGGTYEPIERSRCLPMLTPALVMEALAMCEGSSESAWDLRLRAWVRNTLAPPRPEGGV